MESVLPQAWGNAVLKLSQAEAGLVFLRREWLVYTVFKTFTSLVEVKKLFSCWWSYQYIGKETTKGGWWLSSKLEIRVRTTGLLGQLLRGIICCGWKAEKFLDYIKALIVIAGDHGCPWTFFRLESVIWLEPKRFQEVMGFQEERHCYSKMGAWVWLFSECSTKGPMTMSSRMKKPEEGSFT